MKIIRRQLTCFKRFIPRKVINAARLQPVTEKDVMKRQYKNRVHADGSLRLTRQFNFWRSKLIGKQTSGRDFHRQQMGEKKLLAFLTGKLKDEASNLVVLLDWSNRGNNANQKNNHEHIYRRCKGKQDEGGEKRLKLRFQIRINFIAGSSLDLDKDF